MGKGLKNIFYYHHEDFYYCRNGVAQIGLGLPDCSTDLCPPSCEDGYVPVFDVKAKKWKISLDEFDRSVCFFYDLIYLCHSSRLGSIPHIYALNIGTLEGESFRNIFNFFASLTPLYHYVNPFLIALSFKNRLNYLNSRIKQLFYIHANLFNQLQVYGVISTDDALAYRCEKEEIIHEIKRMLDLMLVAVSMKHSGIKCYRGSNNIQLDSIGQLWSSRIVVPDEIKESMLLPVYQDFLKIINELHNGIKHDILAEEQNLSSLPWEPVITVTKFVKPGRSLKELSSYSISMRSLLFICNDYFCNLLNGTDLHNIQVKNWGSLRLREIKI